MTAPSLDRIVVDGISLESRWIGPPASAAPTIVMLHEGLGSVAQWGRFPDELAAATGCGVFLYSRRGYGSSDAKPAPWGPRYMHDEAAAVLPRVLQAIGFERGILLGHSDGASIATIFAGTVQDHRVRGLALIAPHFFVEPASVAGVELARRAYAVGDLRTRLAKYHGDNVDHVFQGWSETWTSRAFRSWDIRDAIGYIRVPILIVQGTEDQYGTGAQLEAARDEAYCPVDTLLLEGLGHSPHLERRPVVLAAVVDFATTLLDTMGERHGH